MLLLSLKQLQHSLRQHLHSFPRSSSTSSFKSSLRRRVCTDSLFVVCAYSSISVLAASHSVRAKVEAQRKAWKTSWNAWLDDPWHQLREALRPVQPSSNKNNNGSFHTILETLPPLLRHNLQTLQAFWRQTTPAEFSLYALMAVNAVVWVLWQRLPPHWMLQHFTNSRQTAAWTLLTSGFSHQSPLHFSLNMMGLYQLGHNLAESMGPEHFLSFYTLSVLGSSWMSRYAQPSRFGSLGASGAVMACLGAVACRDPEAQWRLIGLPDWTSFSARSALTAVVFWDLFCWATGRWRSIDQAAHVGGVLIGSLYELADADTRLWQPLERTLMQLEIRKSNEK